jgi:hypothetical protein
MHIHKYTCQKTNTISHTCRTQSSSVGRQAHQGHLAKHLSIANSLWLMCRGWVKGQGLKSDRVFKKTRARLQKLHVARPRRTDCSVAGGTDCRPTLRHPDQYSQAEMCTCAYVPL